MTKAELEALIDSGSIEACVVALEGMPEAERTKLGSAAVARLTALGKGIPPRMSSFMDTDLDSQVLAMLSIGVPQVASYRAARAAVLATASFSQWKSVRGHGLPSNELSLRILRDRRPPWLDEMIELVCEADDQLIPRWPLIRGLVRDGPCSPPRSGRYIDRMLMTLPGEALRTPGGLKAALLADPGLLEHEIWRVFETEPGPRAVQLITAAIYGVKDEGTWEGALAQLAMEGTISREKLLDACLDGLSRDLHDLRARWFAVLHDRLEPTPEELAARGARYLDLLGSRNPSTLAFALKILKTLSKSCRLDSAALIDRLEPALHSRTKGTVKQALTLLDQAAGQAADSALKARAVAVAVEGLVHDSADIQAAILDFVELHGDPHDRAIRDVLEARLEAIAVSLRGRLQAWLGVHEQPKEEPIEGDLDDLMRRTAALDPRFAALAGVPEALATVRGERADLPALSFDGTEIPRLDPDRRLEPIDDLDTLIELCSRLIENPEPPEDLDRCADAISRLCDQRPADFEKRTAPLAARIGQQFGSAQGVPSWAMHSFGQIVSGWLTGKVSASHRFGETAALQHFTSAWVRGLARRVAQAQAAPLLAAPTHVGGWIDPRILVERFRTRCQLRIADEPEDLILAILRLAPDHRVTALADAHDLWGEQGAAIRYALGSDAETIGRSAPLWVAAARSRSPWADDPAVEARHPGLGPDAGRAATYHIDGRAMIPRVANQVKLLIGRHPELHQEPQATSELPTVAYHSTRWLPSSDWPSPASIWPPALESFCAVGAQQLVEMSETSSDWTGIRGFLLPLLNPDVPLRPMARLLVAVGLNAKLPELAGLATDALAAAIDDGRLDAETLGESLRIAWRLRRETWTYHPPNDPSFNTPSSEPLVKPSRWAKTLEDVARTSPLHAGVIARSVELVLVDEPSASRTTASMLPLLELLREASVETRRALSAEARAYLGGLSTGGKTGRVVKELLALRDVPNHAALREAQTRALANRIARAERWAEWERTSI